ncbi:MAG: histidine phosphatase family protein [Actinomycetota bacterium]|nr:histidine phosphatase family protein [Actinomycetota bacterium]
MPDLGPVVTLIRHGETTWSARGQHTGRTDLELTETGEAQARGLRVLVAEHPFDVVATSPLRRALRTAELAGLDVTKILDDLREWDYGDLEGLTTPEIQERYPGWVIWNGPWPGGETAADVGQRADRVVAWLMGLPTDTRVALVAHGHILRVLGARWSGAEVVTGRMLALDTASVSELGWEHQRRVVRRWNLTIESMPVTAP